MQCVSIKEIAISLSKLSYNEGRSRKGKKGAFRSGFISKLINKVSKQFHTIESEAVEIRSEDGDETSLGVSTKSLDGNPFGVKCRRIATIVLSM